MSAPQVSSLFTAFVVLVSVMVLPPSVSGNVSGGIVSVQVVQGSNTGSEVVTGGFQENATTHTDRDFQYRQVNQNASFLVGADYVKLQNVARQDNPFEARLSLTLEAPLVDVYVLVDRRVNVPLNMSWLAANGWTNTTAGQTNAQVLGIDENLNGTPNNYSDIWHQRFARPAEGPFVVSTFQQNQGSSNMYGIVAVPIPEPSSALLMLLFTPLFLARRSRRR